MIVQNMKKGDDDNVLNHEKSLDERIEIIDQLINETKKELEHYSELIYPKYHEFYRIRLHYYELTRDRLKFARGKQIIKRYEE